MKDHNQLSCSPRTSADLAAKALKRRISRNVDRVRAFDEAMFCWHYRYAILVMTLCYADWCKHDMTFASLKHDRDTLLKNLNTNTLLQGILGYIWKIEWGGRGGGLHLHLVLYYDSDRITPECNDKFHTEQIKRYWIDVVTGGRGDAWNSNQDTVNKDRFGDVTGLVYRSDAEKRGLIGGKGLRAYYSEYICKESQQVGERGPHDQMFNTSEFPRERVVRLPQGMVNERQVDYIAEFVEAVHRLAPAHYSTVVVPGMPDGWIHIGPGWLMLSQGAPVHLAQDVLIRNPKVRNRQDGSIAIDVSSLDPWGVAVFIDALLQAMFKMQHRYWVQAFISPSRS